MRTVWKYNLTPDTVLDLCLVTPKIVFVDCEPQNSLPSIWVEHGGITDLARMCVTFIGTGHEVPQPRPGWDYWRHIGSCRSQNGFFVWHAYHAVPAVPGWGS